MKRSSGQIQPSQFLTPDEQEQLMACASARATHRRGRRAYLILDLMINTGLPATEVAKLRLQDTPDYLGCANESQVIQVQGKFKKNRFVPISPRLADKIRQYIKKDRSKFMPRWARKKDASGFLFWTQSKKPLLRKVSVKNPKTGKRERQERASGSLYQLVRRHGVYAGLGKPLYPHILRHSFAMNQVGRSKVNLAQLMSMMGHTHISATDKYAHFVEVSNLGSAIDVPF